MENKECFLIQRAWEFNKFPSLIIDEDFSISSINTKGRKLFSGLDVGDNIFNYTHCPQLAEAFSFFKDPENKNASYVTATKPGNYELFQIYGEPFSFNGRFYTLLVFIDVTIAVNDTRTALLHSKRVHKIGELSTHISHDLKNPLTVILGCCELAKDEQATESIRSLFSDVEKAVFKALNFVDELNAFALGKKLTLHKEEVEINQWLSRILKESHYLHLVEFMPGKETYLCMDSVKMHNAVWNIVRNALEAVDDIRDGRVLITHATKEKFIEITIEDNGPGIDEEEQKKLFHLGVSKGKKNGKGIGLHSVYETIRLHEGEVSCTSKSTGTIFVIKLPRVTKKGEDK